MRKAKEIKVDLLAALGSIGDEAFIGMGFKRRKGSLNYVRTIRDAKQTIAFVGNYSPRYEPGAEVHLLPNMHLAMKPVTEAALRLVSGNKMLLANAPDIIVNQPIEFTAPKSEHVYWFATGPDQIKERVVEIDAFVKKWVMPFLDELTTVDELIEVYRRADARMGKQQRLYLFIAAAFMVKGNDHEALNVLEEKLGAPGVRKIFAVAFENLTPS